MFVSAKIVAGCCLALRHPFYSFWPSWMSSCGASSEARDAQCSDLQNSSVQWDNRTFFFFFFSCSFKTVASLHCEMGFKVGGGFQAFLRCFEISLVCSLLKYLKFSCPPWHGALLPVLVQPCSKHLLYFFGFLAACSTYTDVHVKP